MTHLKAEGCNFEKKLQRKNARKEYVQIIQSLSVSLGFPFILCFKLIRWMLVSSFEVVRISGMREESKCKAMSQYDSRKLSQQVVTRPYTRQNQLRSVGQEQ